MAIKKAKQPDEGLKTLYTVFDRIKGQHKMLYRGYSYRKVKEVIVHDSSGTCMLEEKTKFSNGKIHLIRRDMEITEYRRRPSIVPSKEHKKRYYIIRPSEVKDLVEIMNQEVQIARSTNRISCTKKKDKVNKVKNTYKGHECSSCGYQKTINYNKDFPNGQLLLYALSAKAFFPIERARKIKLPRLDCPKCGREDTFYSPWLERKVAELDKQYLKRQSICH